MIHTTNILDVTPFLEQRAEPGLPLPKTREESWIVRVTPYNFDEPNDGPLDWMRVNGGDLVPIPLIPYRVSLELPHAMLGVADVMRRYAMQFPHATRSHLIIGTPVEDLRPEFDAYRLWLGFAVQTN